jgi:hypothetical protein
MPEFGFSAVFPYLLDDLPAFIIDDIRYRSFGALLRQQDTGRLADSPGPAGDNGCLP